MKELNSPVLKCIRDAAVKFLYLEVSATMRRLGPASDDDRRTILVQMLKRPDVAKTIRDLSNVIELLDLFDAIQNYSQTRNGATKQ